MSIKPKIDVIVDTNIIYTGDTGRYLTTRSFKDAIAGIRKKADINVHVPEMVFEEVYFQKRSALERDYQGICLIRDRIERLVNTKVNLRHSLETLRSRLKKALLGDLEKSDFKLLKFSLPANRWKRIAQAVVRREEPFDKEGEAAYRDSVIRAQAHEFSLGQKGGMTVFLVGDKNSRSAAAQLVDEKRFIVLPSVESLAALVDDLNLKNAQRLKEVRILAAKAFMDRKEGYFRKWNLEGKIQDKIGTSSFVHAAMRLPLGATGPFLFASQLAKYPALETANNSTEVLQFNDRGEYEFQSKISYIFHSEAGNTGTGVNVERRQYDVIVNWTAQVEGSNISAGKEKELIIGPEEKSQFFVDLWPGVGSLSHISSANSLGLTGSLGSTGPLSALTYPLGSNSIGLSGGADSKSLGNIYLGALGATGPSGPLDVYKPLKL
jgi:hypothetical protein